MPSSSTTASGSRRSGGCCRRRSTRASGASPAPCGSALYKGSVTVEGRKAPTSLYSAEHATFEADSVYDQRDAEGFIKLNALRLRLGKTGEDT